jgi:hypothetical protein
MNGVAYIQQFTDELNRTKSQHDKLIGNRELCQRYLLILNLYPEIFNVLEWQLQDKNTFFSNIRKFRPDIPNGHLVVLWSLHQHGTLNTHDKLIDKYIYLVNHEIAFYDYLLEHIDKTTLKNINHLLAHRIKSWLPDKHYVAILMEIEKILISTLRNLNSAKSYLKQLKKSSRYPTKFKRFQKVCKRYKFLTDHLKERYTLIDQQIKDHANKKIIQMPIADKHKVQFRNLAAMLLYCMVLISGCANLEERRIIRDRKIPIQIIAQTNINQEINNPKSREVIPTEWFEIPNGNLNQQEVEQLSLRKALTDQEYHSMILSAKRIVKYSDKFSPKQKKLFGISVGNNEQQAQIWMSSVLNLLPHEVETILRYIKFDKEHTPKWEWEFQQKYYVNIIGNTTEENVKLLENTFIKYQFNPRETFSNPIRIFFLTYGQAAFTIDERSVENDVGRGLPGGSIVLRNIYSEYNIRHEFAHLQVDSKTTESIGKQFTNIMNNADLSKPGLFKYFLWEDYSSCPRNGYITPYSTHDDNEHIAELLVHVNEFKIDNNSNIWLIPHTDPDNINVYLQQYKVLLDYKLIEQYEYDNIASFLKTGKDLNGNSGPSNVNKIIKNNIEDFINRVIGGIENEQFSKFKQISQKKIEIINKYIEKAKRRINEILSSKQSSRDKIDKINFEERIESDTLRTDLITIDLLNSITIDSVTKKIEAYEQLQNNFPFEIEESLGKLRQVKSKFIREHNLVLELLKQCKQTYKDAIQQLRVS